MENKQLNLSEPENIMGTMDVNPLLIKLSIPMMISMLVQALYNVVDSIFVARVSENALTAVSLAFSLQNMMFAVGIGTGVGVNALLSKSLGEKNQYRANKTAENGLFLALCSYLVFLVLGLTVVRPYFYAQTADADIAEQGIRYLTICCVLSLGMFMQVMNEKLLAATSRTTLSMISQLVGAIVNIILDPIFIFGYCGEALSGTTGAALATVIGQFCGAGVSFYLNLRKNPDIQLDFKGFRPSAEAIKRIYVVGLPSIAMQCVGSVMTFLMNQILMAFTATAVAVFGVYFKLQSFVFMPIFGMNNGMVPIISYNYGARKPERVKKTIRLAVFYAECIMLVGFCIFQFLPDKLLGLFAASDAMLAIGIAAHHLPPLPAGGCRHRAELGVPGAGQRRVQPDRLHLPSAGGAHPRCMAAEPHRRGEHGLVGLHHRGGGQPCAEPRFHGPHQPYRHRPALRKAGRGRIT